MYPDPPGNGDPRRHQHRWPDHGVKAGDVLPDDVQIGGPQLLVIGIGKPGRGQIVRQRVEPDVRRLLLTAADFAREGNSP